MEEAMAKANTWCYDEEEPGDGVDEGMSSGDAAAFEVGSGSLGLAVQAMVRAADSCSGAAKIAKTFVYAMEAEEKILRAASIEVGEVMTKMQDPTCRAR